MPRYYQGHEGVYRRLAAEDADCWGLDDFDNVHMLSFLNDALARTDLDDREHVNALVIGCGTGPVACALRKRGYQVSGFDVSPTAILLAKQQADKRGLTIDYWVGDICRDTLAAGNYDLIIDSHCLHCIVPNEDRQTAFESIWQALTEDGYFILETMMGKVSTEERSTDEDGIVWTSYGESEPDFEPRVQRDGLWFVPQRRLRPNKAALDQEVTQYGFRINWSQSTKPEVEDGLCDYQAICQRA